MAKWEKGKMKKFFVCIFAILFCACSQLTPTQADNLTKSIKQNQELSQSDKIKAYAKACSKKAFSSCYELGNLFISKQDPKRASKYYKIACDNTKDEIYCLALGSAYTQIGKNYDKTHWKKRFSGERNSDVALRFFTQACDVGDQEGCFFVAKNYQNLSFKNKEYLNLANKLYQKACDSDIFAACRELGVNYLQGSGLEINPQKSINLISKSCENKDAHGCYLLSQVFQYIKDYEKERLFLELAIKFGDKTAYNNLGVLYEEGKSVPKDTIRAKEFYGIACDAGMQKACQNYKRLNQ